MTIDIIKKWENIGENYLNSNLQYTNDRSQKITFNEAIKKTIENFPSNIEKHDIKSTFEAIYHINSKFKKKSFRDISITEVYNNFIKIAYTKLIEQHSFRDLAIHVSSNNQEIEKINQNPKIINLNKEISELEKKSGENSKTDFKILFKKSQLQVIESNLISKLKDKDTYKDEFFNILLSKAFEKEGVNTRGIIYQIKNKKGFVSYIIGTNHKSIQDVNKKIILDKNLLLKGTIIPEIVKKSSEFISELGWVPLKPNSMDEELTILARNINIPIHALETLEEIEKSRSSLNSCFIKSKYDKKLNKIEKNGQIALLQDIKINPLINSFNQLINWRNGDITKMQLDLKIYSAFSPIITKQFELLKKRNKNWLENKNINLLNKLENTEQQIVIVVGAAHLFGKRGLLKAFEDYGLNIQQI